MALVPPLIHAGSCAASLRAKSSVASNPHAGTSAATELGRISAINFLPLNSGLRKSSHFDGILHSWMYVQEPRGDHPCDIEFHLIGKKRLVVIIRDVSRIPSF